MREVVENAMASKEARDAFQDGWSLAAIREAICVGCGDIGLHTFTDGHRSCRDGRKIGYRSNGTQYDAGRLCERCMAPRTIDKTEPE